MNLKVQTEQTPDKVITDNSRPTSTGQNAYSTKYQRGRYDSFGLLRMHISQITISISCSLIHSSSINILARTVMKYSRDWFFQMRQTQIKTTVSITREAEKGSDHHEPMIFPTTFLKPVFRWTCRCPSSSGLGGCYLLWACSLYRHHACA